MSPQLKQGLVGRAALVVAEDHTAPRVGSGRVHVLATPVMINLIEAAALAAVEHLLPAGHQSLGTVLNVRHIAATERYDAVVAVGAVIRGETPHFDYISNEAARGLSQAIAEFDLPIGFGLLTCDNLAQAEARAGGDHGNKGWDAALAALEMADLFDRLDAAEQV